MTHLLLTVIRYTSDESIILNNNLDNLQGLIHQFTDTFNQYFKNPFISMRFDNEVL